MASIQTSLFRQAGAAPAKAALAAPGRCPLTYSALAALIEQASADLRRFGVAPGERVALIAPNGPEMAAAFLAITSVASCAPLNPAYRAEEFAFYLEDLRASTLVVAEGMAAEAVQVARDLGLRLVELRPDTGGAAGSFTFCGTPAAAAPAGPPAPSRGGPAGATRRRAGGGTGRSAPRRRQSPPRG
ncbi:MAG TPA: AMP-binding protein, partial [Bryobacteraceae bacterium]|nr:AMP-binding protein [Bryobacteraceae bacterium]